MSRDWSEEYLDENCCLKIFIGQLEKQLKIATKALKSIKHKIDDFEDDPMNKIEFMAYGNLWSVRDMAKEALKRIKKLDNELELDK